MAASAGTVIRIGIQLIDNRSSPMPTFGPRVCLESRRAREMASIVSSYGGQPISAPSMREVPLESNTEALAFADALERDEFDLVILLTGVGTRALVEVVEQVQGQRDAFVARLAERSPGARSEAGGGAARAGTDALAHGARAQHLARGAGRARRRARELPLPGTRVAVQEYGASNPELLAGLEERGAL